MEKESNPLHFSDLAGILEQMLSSPEIMSAVASLLTMLKGTPSAPTQQGEENVSTLTQSEPLAQEESAPTMALPPPKRSLAGQKREMLSAIRPYMSERRCQMIDRMTHAADLVQLLSRR